VDGYARLRCPHRKSGHKSQTEECKRAHIDPNPPGRHELRIESCHPVRLLHAAGKIPHPPRWIDDSCRAITAEAILPGAKVSIWILEARESKRSV
jgi:hypothetical protein